MPTVFLSLLPTLLCMQASYMYLTFTPSVCLQKCNINRFNIDAYDDIVRFSIILLFHWIVRNFCMLRNNACLLCSCLYFPPYYACKLHTFILLLLPLSAYKNMTLTTLICKVTVLSLTTIKDAYDDIVRFF